jgi:hypothetical protein
LVSYSVLYENGASSSVRVLSFLPVANEARQMDLQSGLQFMKANDIKGAKKVGKVR